MSGLSVANYAPWGNAQLQFSVSNARISIDQATGNPITGETVLDYLASVKLSRPNWKSQEGADMTTYQCTGRLLYPAVFDERITNGSRASAVINGYRGRLELSFDLAMDADAYSTLRQSFQGVFRVIGGKYLKSPLQ